MTANTKITNPADSIEWQLIDNDNIQYTKKGSGPHSWIFKQFDRGEYPDHFRSLTNCKNELELSIPKLWDIPKYWVETEVNLNQYTEQEMFNLINGYFDDYEQFKEFLKNEPCIIAEYIFECTRAIYFLPEIS